MVWFLFYFLKELKFSFGGRPCHTLRGFVKVAIWGRLRMNNICSLFVQVHKKSRNDFVRPYPSPTLALLLSSCKLRTRVTKQLVTAQYELFLLLSLILFYFAIVNLFWLRITARIAWRLLLEDRES